MSLRHGQDAHTNQLQHTRRLETAECSISTPASSAGIKATLNGSVDAVGVRYRSMPLSLQMAVAQYSTNICCISARMRPCLGPDTGRISDSPHPPLGHFRSRRTSARRRELLIVDCGMRPCKYGVRLTFD